MTSFSVKKTTGTILLIMFFCFISESLLFAAEIHDAARDGDIERLIMLAESDPESLYDLCSMGKTPLHWATGKGHPEIITLLLERFKVPADIRNANNGTPLHVAASQARPDCAEILIEHGADLNARAKDNAAPLHFACFKGQKSGHIAVAKLLLQKGCDVNPEMKNRATPMNLAKSRNNSEVIELLKKYDAKSNVIDTSVKMGHYDFIGGTAYKKEVNNQSKGNNFSPRKRMILQRFDTNKDGFLDENERQKARNFMKNRMQRRRFD
jgi:ankyrin repeat protein